LTAKPERQAATLPQRYHGRTVPLRHGQPCTCPSPEDYHES
jgi:hypothetical protein